MIYKEKNRNGGSLEESVLTWESTAPILNSNLMAGVYCQIYLFVKFFHSLSLTGLTSYHCEMFVQFA